jgi:hypothetical protein
MGSPQRNGSDATSHKSDVTIPKLQIVLCCDL